MAAPEAEQEEEEEADEEAAAFVVATAAAEDEAPSSFTSVISVSSCAIRLRRPPMLPIPFCR